MHHPIPGHMGTLSVRVTFKLLLSLKFNLSLFIYHVVPVVVTLLFILLQKKTLKCLLWCAKIFIRDWTILWELCTWRKLKPLIIVLPSSLSCCWRRLKRVCKVRTWNGHRKGNYQRYHWRLDCYFLWGLCTCRKLYNLNLSSFIYHFGPVIVIVTLCLSCCRRRH